MDTRLVVGQVLAGRYFLEEHLGRGAMGDVFRARHIKVPRAFAIKVLHPQLVADPKVCIRFEREAELAGRLRHPNVISVLDVGETAKSRYIVMELAVGDSLTNLIAEGPFTAQRVIDLVRPICDGLHHAHEHEVIHRDLKPDNVIVERTPDAELPRIVDFGLAILRDAASSDTDRLTTAGIVLGTPHYLAPETATGKSIDRRADLFALGVIMYEMLTGVMPFEGDGVQVATANVDAPTPAMRTRAPHVTVDPLLEALTRWLLAKRPEHRPATALEVRRVLGLIQTDRVAAAALLEPELTWLRAVTGAPGAGVRVPEAGVPPPEAGVPAPEAGVPSPEAGVPAPETGALAFRPTERGIATEPVIRLVAPRRRIAVVAATLVLVIAIVVTSRVLRSHDRPRAVEVTLPESAPQHARTASTREHLGPIAVAPVAPAAHAPMPAESTAHRRLPDPVPDHVMDHVTDHVTDPVNAPAIAVPAPDHQIAAAVVPAQPPTESPPVTTETVLHLYASLGRQLKRISDRRDMSADDLWQRYRRVRIQDAIASSDKRAEAMNILSAIEREITARFSNMAL